MESKPKASRPGVGVGICVLSEEGKLLMGKRLGSNLYGFPGGHLERLESWEECGLRELKEETNLDVEEKDLKFFVANNIVEVEQNYHYLDINLVCKYPKDQTLINLEPEKCESWEWWTLEEIETRKAEIFYPIQVLLKQKEEVFNLKNLRKKIGQEN